MSIKTIISELKSLIAKKRKHKKLEWFVSLAVSPILLVSFMLFPTTEMGKDLFQASFVGYLLLSLVLYAIPSIWAQYKAAMLDSNIRELTRNLSDEQVIELRNSLLVEESEIHQYLAPLKPGSYGLFTLNY